MSGRVTPLHRVAQIRELLFSRGRKGGGEGKEKEEKEK